MTLADPIQKPQLTILLVEDDDGDAEGIERAFRESGSIVRIVRAVDGMEALVMLRDRNAHQLLGPRCLLLVDLNMPRMNGLELVAAIRQDPALRRLVVFVVTASNMAFDKRAAYELNVAGYIVKQSDGEELQDLVSLIESYRHLVELPVWA
jgi:CheY-like chemotaxis protein